ncbi:zinc finger protein 26-like isoform X2 [Sitodiplosis mosellana]|uniref:zinc finger protein 26-like isoform X2 n=1 Tax=Sitodiplosis mosellana TaxID=263140 RepID=UPI002443AFFB|nr:zinc finger protein 26-like isoform X2 [Sitodiplosis mosellana]
MYQIESVFIGESQHGEPLIKSEVQTEIINNFKVGDVTMITRMDTNNFTLNLNCAQCSRSFRNFPEFTKHIEKHFLHGDVFISNDITSDNAMKNESTKTTTAAVEEEEEGFINDENEPEIPDDEMEYMNESVWNNQFMVECDLQTENEIKHPTYDGTAPATFDLSQFVEGVTYKKVENVYECMICGFQSVMKSNLKSHIAVHVKVKNVFCSICMKGFGSVHYAQKHIKSIHKETISAEAIRKAQKTLSQIVKPKKSDRNGNAPDEVSKLKLNLLSSNYWRTEGKRYHCVFCVQWFKNPKYVQKHIRLVHGRTIGLDDILAAQIQPELKPEPTKSVELVTQKQIESLRREQAQTDVSNRVKSSFECFACHTKFVSEKALRYHMPLHEGIQYKCPLCEKFFQLPKYVRDHMIYKHDFDKKSKLPPLKTRKIENFEYHKPVVSRFECYLCHRTYPSRSKLNSHMKSHLDILECSVCTKVFKSTESRRRHMQLHSADPNLQHHCSLCDKAFPVRRYLMSHMRTSHRNPKSKIEKPPKAPPKMLTCDICQKIFDKQGMFNKHMKRHNKEPTSFMCDHCGT